jgi:hypothetical protein
VTARAVGFVALSLALSSSAAAAGPPSRLSEQLLPLPAIGAPPVPAPLPPPTNPGFAVAPSGGISPLLLQPGPAEPLPPPSGSPAYPSLSLPAPIDQQKIGSYRSWLLGQQRLLQRGGADDYLSRQIQQQLLQLDQSDGSR